MLILRLPAVLAEEGDEPESQDKARSFPGNACDQQKANGIVLRTQKQTSFRVKLNHRRKFTRKKIKRHVPSA